MSEPNAHPMRGLLVAQFFGAFNDNAWKMIVIALALAAALDHVAVDHPWSQERARAWWDEYLPASAEPGKPSTDAATTQVLKTD